MVLPCFCLPLCLQMSARMSVCHFEGSSAVVLSSREITVPDNCYCEDSVPSLWSHAVVNVEPCLDSYVELCLDMFPDGLAWAFREYSGLLGRVWASLRPPSMASRHSCSLLGCLGADSGRAWCSLWASMGQFLKTPYGTCRGLRLPAAVSGLSRSWFWAVGTASEVKQCVSVISDTAVEPFKQLGRTKCNMYLLHCIENEEDSKPIAEDLICYSSLGRIGKGPAAGGLFESVV